MSYTLPQNNTQYDSLIKKWSDYYGINFNLAKALVWQESAFKSKAVSPAGAKGLTQLMPGTAKEMGVTDVFDPEQSIKGGLGYLAKKLKETKGNISLALAAYNAGYGNVKKYGGIPPFTETQNYVKNILARKEQLDGKKKCSQCGQFI